MPMLRYLIVFSIVAFMAILWPLQVHFLIVLFDKLLYLSDFSIIENTTILQHSIAVVFYKKLCRTCLG